MYVTLCTRLNICFAVGLVSHYQSNPGHAYWQVVNKVFCYLRGPSDLIFCYQHRDLKFRGYSDFDWNGYQEELRSTSEYVFTLDEGVIS